jgi:exodeoxyribonuclease VII small subunit
MPQPACEPRALPNPLIRVIHGSSKIFVEEQFLERCEEPSPISPEVALFSVARLCLIPRLPVSSKPKQRETELNFEGAMDRLEKIVEQMESGKLPLEDLIVRYEEGMNLVKICQERLANAEQKIEIIARNSAGKTVVKEFEPTREPEIPARVAVEPEDTNDEIKLF